MSNEHLILCGSAKLSSRQKEWRNARTVSLSTERSADSVFLRIDDLTARLVANLKDLELDLLEIAAYVYAADQATRRGGLKLIDYGRSWYRNFRFEMPVRQPDFWSSVEVKGELERTLCNASGDNFDFVFSKQKKPPPTESYFEWGKDDIADVDEVMLFSGGMDSLGGAVRETLSRNRKVVLVSHRSAPQVDSRQRQLVSAISGRVTDSRKAPVHVPVWVNKKKALGKEFTQRTRSFLYCTLGAVVARLFGLKRIRLYENGVTSLNLPISAQVVSTRATRTTHPMVLSGYRNLIGLVLGEEFGIETPFFWMTKTEVLREIKDAGHSLLCAMTVSCAHTWDQEKGKPHCGACSQCIERRLVALAAGYNEEEDPLGMYRRPFLTSAVDEEELLLVEAYLETIRKIQRIDSVDAFWVAYPELCRAINHLDGAADPVARRVTDLYQRHARQVGGALDDQGRQVIQKLRLGELPANCGLCIAFSNGRNLADTAIQAPAAAAHGNGHIVDEATFSVVWPGRDPVQIGNRKEFRLLQALAAQPGKFHQFTELARSIGGDELDDLAPVKSRLVKFLQQNGLDELARCIQTQTGHYGLFLS